MVCGVGINDVEGGSSDPCYYAWLGMISRCYSHKNIDNPTLTVADEWIKLSGFIAWVDDKDIFKMRFKRQHGQNYSPSTCEFV